eukprot:CAMPEP_0113895928 /NCGR_PEP_ID=MMETSP0780_2-20120614/17679_1 /TAXON_ID=652834 /ORGANISM="Palpitomonas bilix" /LENGTH=292 /DNA_ID=CAMNT_0000886901 /DNA_START=142 /DNA_END=1016 /DNA_ORIENTATION=+ /assembly_acc=CAM_ASM_000599
MLGKRFFQWKKEKPAGTAGYRVMRVENDSPAQHAGLCAFLDYITEVEGKDFGKVNDSAFRSAMVSKIGGGEEVKMRVYSTLRRSFRDVYLKPTLIPNQSGGGKPRPYVGLGYQHEEFQVISAFWRILSVEDGSPSHKAGLEGSADYIIGTTEGPFRTPSSFEALLTSSVDKEVHVVVYHSKVNEENGSAVEEGTREVTLVPSRKWEKGEASLLGARVGGPPRHAIPQPSTTDEVRSPAERFSAKSFLRKRNEGKDVQVASARSTAKELENEPDTVRQLLDVIEELQQQLHGA